MSRLGRFVCIVCAGECVHLAQSHTWNRWVKCVASVTVFLSLFSSPPPSCIHFSVTHIFNQSVFCSLNVLISLFCCSLCFFFFFSLIEALNSISKNHRLLPMAIVGATQHHRQTYRDRTKWGKHACSVQLSTLASQIPVYCTSYIF